MELRTLNNKINMTQYYLGGEVRQLKVKKYKWIVNLNFMDIRELYKVPNIENQNR